MRIQEINKVAYIAIPKTIIKKKKWKKGTELIPSFNERGNLEYEAVE